MFFPVVRSVLLFLVILVSLSSLGAIFVRKYIPPASRVALRPMTQPALTVLGVMFSLLIGFFIADSMRSFALATSNANNEANAVGQVFRTARGLPLADAKKIRGLCRQYVDAVIDDEWALMAESKYSLRAWHLMDNLWNAALSVNPTCRREEIIYSNIVASMESLGGFRRLRIGTNLEGLESHIWAIIASGAASIVVATFLFAPESKTFHVGILSCLLVPLTLNVFLLAEFSYPFGGVVIVKPSMFEFLRDQLFVQPDTPLPGLDPAPVEKPGRR